MKAIIRDIDVLKAIELPQVAIYLQANGWYKDSDNERASNWVQKTDAGEEFEILLPLKSDIPDFHRRMRDVLEILEFTETRSQLDILHDIRNSEADTIRFCLGSPLTVNSSIPLEDSISLIQLVRDVMLWTACSTLNPQTYFQDKAASAVELFAVDAS